MKRVLVFSSDLLFFSQTKGTVEPLGWTAQRLGEPRLPTDWVDGDCLVVDATREIDKAWKILEDAKQHCPWLVVVAHQHLHPEVGEEALRRGATEAVRRGAILSRLAQRLGASPLPPGTPFTGPPPG